MSEDEEILLIIIDTLRREADVWTAMDRWPTFVDALLERSAILEARGEYHKSLPALLLELARNGHLSPDEEKDVNSLIAKHSNVRLYTAIPNRVKS